MTRVLTIVTLFALALGEAGAAAPDTEPRIRIGVVEDGSQHGLSRWQPTAGYLERLVQGHRFGFFSYDAGDLRPALDRRELDFVLTDASLFIDLESNYNLTPVVMRRMWQHAEPSARFGALIFTRADRHDITELDDLRGKSFMAPYEGFGRFYPACANCAMSVFDRFAISRASRWKATARNIS